MYVWGMRGEPVACLLLNRGKSADLTEHERRVQAAPPVPIPEHETGIPLKQLESMYPCPPGLTRG